MGKYQKNIEAAVRLGAILLVRFANQFAGVIGLKILHHADTPRSFDFFLIFATLLHLSKLSKGKLYLFIGMGCGAFLSPTPPLQLAEETAN